MKPSKPITQNMKDKANTLYRIMQDGKWHTKEELGTLLGIKNERSVRDVISTLSKCRPIISTSDGKGYKMALYVKDMEEVKHARAELDSRIAELTERRQCLDEFYKQAEAMKRSI